MDTLGPGIFSFIEVVLFSEVKNNRKVNFVLSRRFHGIPYVLARYYVTMRNTTQYTIPLVGQGEKMCGD